MYYYWHSGDLKQAEEEIFKGITLKGKYDVIEAAYNEAVKLDPHNSGLKFSLASTQIIQKKIPEALQTYQQILNLNPDNYNANLLYGVYSKVNGDEKAYKAAIANLKRLDAQCKKQRPVVHECGLLGLRINRRSPQCNQR
ncbi:tetratricopeptide repeat protein [Neobacillus niacini]|uniref:tetratricopeptide repeat protein n=1 Tax=Neobacillus niacini TaxID=86668 RepID=UPI0021CB405B|nr:tetratricopeptide repeat protein [Neobacillus niacini]MCM3763795.1 tetratricopeptide repeat protein [Neobacillus niacini]